MPKLDEQKFRNYCKHVSKAELQKATGLSRQTLYNRTRNTETLTLNNFLAICEAIGEDHNSFILDNKERI